MTVLPEVDLERVCAYYESFCESLQSTSILISGATGFVGSWLVESLLRIDRKFDLQMSITGITRNASKARQAFKEYSGSNLEFLEFDISERNEITGSFSHIFHAATPTTAGARAGDLENVYRSSVTGAKNLLAHAQKQGNRPVFLHTSSGAVYGAQPKSLARFPLNWPRQELAPSDTVKNEYARAKIDTEILIESATNDGIIEGINARMFAFMGPRLPLREHYAIGNFVYSGIHENAIKVQGDGQSIRSYQHASDMTSQLIYLLSKACAGNYHVGSAEGRTILEWADLVGLVCDKPIEILHSDSSVATIYVPETDLRIPPGLGEAISKAEHISRWITWLCS